MLERIQEIEQLNRRLWGGRVTLAVAAHALGGVGLGLLASRRTARQARPLARAMVAFYIVAHLYALLTMRRASPGLSMPGMERGE